MGGRRRPPAPVSGREPVRRRPGPFDAWWSDDAGDRPTGPAGQRPAGSREAPDPEPPAPVRPGSVGVFGGTFDPVHLGHLAVAQEARESLGLERVLFVVAGKPPHKPDRPISPTRHRLAMVELAIAEEPAFVLSRLEADRPGPSYAVDTVERLAADERAAGREPDLTFVLSAEAFAGLPSWRDPERLLRLCRLAVVPRPGHRPLGRAWLEEHFPGLEDRVTFLSGPHVGISASEVRRRAGAGRSIRYMVPPAVADYIVDHALYSNDLWRKN